MKKYLVLFCLLVVSGHVWAARYEMAVEKNKAVLKQNGVPLLTTLQIETVTPAECFVPQTVEKRGENEFAVSYLAQKNPAAARLISVHTVKGNKIDNRYVLSLAATQKKLDGVVQFEGQPPANDLASVWKSGKWTQDKKGGVPYEVKDGSFQRFEYPNCKVWVRYHSGSVTKRQDARNIVFRAVPKKENEYEGTSHWIVLPRNCEGSDASAVSNDYFCNLQLKTPRAFNLWETGTPEFSVKVWNPSENRTLEAELLLKVYDYDGNTVMEKKKPLKVKPMQSFSETFKPVPADVRGIWFVEATMKSGTETIFTRTNIALLPPHQFKKPQAAIGIAAFFPIPSEEAVFQLMKRIGVQNLRNNDQRQSSLYGIRSYGHYNIRRSFSFEKARDVLKEKLPQMKEKEVIALELGNEWNIHKKGTKSDIAKQYVQLYRMTQELEKELNCNVPLLPLGVAGPDIKFFQELQKNGLWNDLSGIVVHIGRGNVTPDYDGPTYFCYLGAIRKVKKFLKENGDKKLYLSEVYATTPPNTTWNDSYRRAGENVLLSLALGVAEGVETIQFYQMHDATWYDRGGVNPKYHEYHYGLLLRYGAIKPSLLAYATAAEELDGAVFKRYISQPDSTLRGMVFDTPKGEMAILYDRSEGCFQSGKANPNKTREPWQDHWKVQKDYSFAANGKPVVVKDCMGREKKVVVKDGKVQLKLSGAPLIVRGLRIQ